MPKNDNTAGSGTDVAGSGMEVKLTPFTEKSCNTPKHDSASEADT